MGLPVLPYILREIRDAHSGTDWLIAIRAITGKGGPPISEDERGRVAILKRRYLDWAIAEGHQVAATESKVRPFWEAVA